MTFSEILACISASQSRVPGMAERYLAAASNGLSAVREELANAERLLAARERELTRVAEVAK